MIIDNEAILALNRMKNDIENTMIKHDLDRWSYHITIYSKNDVGLYYSSYLLKLLDVRTGFIGMVPVNYKYCAFDCFTICNIFHDIYSYNNINIDGISILECESINDNDFYLLIMKDDRMNDERNIVMAYKTFHEYYSEQNKATG